MPGEVPKKPTRAAEAWEPRECRLLPKPCPLGLFDSVEWHAHHFRRIRRWDARWRAAPAWVGLPQYLTAFLDARGAAELGRNCWREAQLRLTIAATVKPDGKTLDFRLEGE